MNANNKILAIAGPTASGKTALSIEVAKRIGGEIISNDSMQIYRGMEIGTAAPNKAEMQGIEHHLIGIKNPCEKFSCADYALLAKEEIENIRKKDKIPIFCGGTGLYLDSVIKVNRFSESGDNSKIREKWAKYACDYGVLALHDRLKEIDEESAAAIHPNNVRRVIRAIEIFETTGKTKSQWDKESLFQKDDYNCTIVVLSFFSRDVLFERIDRRVDQMIEAGLEEEVKALWENGLLLPDKPAFQAIGYKEFIPYFQGEITLSETVAAVKIATRHYAKRQITWFKRYKDAIILTPDNFDKTLKSPGELADELVNFWETKQA